MHDLVTLLAGRTASTRALAQDVDPRSIRRCLLSHWSALHLHKLLDEGVTRLDVTVPVHHRLRSSRRLRIDRTRRPCPVELTRGLATTDLARSLVDT